VYRASRYLNVDSKLFFTELRKPLGNFARRTVVLDDDELSIFKFLNIGDESHFVETTRERLDTLLEWKVRELASQVRDYAIGPPGEQSRHGSDAERKLDLVQQLTGERRRRIGKEAIAVRRQLVAETGPAALTLFEDVRYDPTGLELLEVATDGDGRNSELGRERSRAQCASALQEIDYLRALLRQKVE
jgi:hypothetical protein